MYKRPQKGESEEDLLKLQEEFFKNKAENKLQPAAKISACRAHASTSSHVEDYEPPEQLSNTFETIPSNVNIGRIIEKIPGTVKYETTISTHQNKGFPIAKRRDPSIKSTKGSLFSQQMKRIKRDETSRSATNLPSESYIISGKEKHEVHQQNIDIMSKMTEEEIMEEREKLMSTLDPAIVAFLKSKRFHSFTRQDHDKPDMETQNKAGDDIKAEDIYAVSNILAKPKSEKWLHFDKLETNKLAWMKNFDMSQQLKDGGDYEARFDFGGWLLPYTTIEINETNRALYHHGDEPERPGYTLQELFQLCRSNITQQRVVALNTIANILSLESSGIYDGIIDVPIEQVFFVLRFCLDDNTPSVLNACVKALRNLFYYPIDEACADSLLGFGLGTVQPSLSSEERDDDDDETVNDQQLAEINLVKCLIRTDFLNRVRYIINTVKPTNETVCYCLELLIRISRDLARISKLVYRCENLVASIMNYFVPKVLTENKSQDSYGVPLKQAVKFLRILATRSEQIASDLVNKHKVMDSILTYLSKETFSSNTNGLQLQIESIHFWIVLINYNLALDHFAIMQPVLLQMLHYHINNSDSGMSSSYTIQGHVSAVLNLIAEVATKKFEYVVPYINILRDKAALKWTSQFSCLNNFTCGKLVIVSAMLHCLKFTNVNSYVQNMINSKGFHVVTSNIKSGSNILSKHEPHKPCKNLITMEAAVWNGSEHIVPILQTNSCLPFLCNLSEFVESSADYQLKLSFLGHDNVQKFLASVKSTRTYNLMSNWFTRIESTLILNVLKISTALQNDLDTSVYYEIAVKCLSIFNSEQKSEVDIVLRTIIFNRNYYSHETLMRNLDINNEALTTSLNNLEHILATYSEILGLSTVRLTHVSNLCVDIKIGNIIPVDWIYSPIIALYSNKQQNKDVLSEEKLTFIVTNCLRWTLIYETYFPELALMIKAVDKYCRLACVFLGSDDLFFVPEIHNLLHQCLELLVKSDLDFDETVHGLNNFQDFYTQLLEQYQGVSYGDALFGNFVLIPLMQKQNVKYRKLLWSEYAGVAQICNVTNEQLMCPLETFLNPPETDLSLLKCYRRAIVMKTLPEKSVLYIIANYHVDYFISNKK